ncbi:hypothetical protein N7454_010748 [Penicillium verhagenii]|nr:hypothetical protein N7454_010748 [Penicillium verhagenii]
MSFDHSFKVETLKEQWKNLANALPPTRVSALESVSFGPIFKLAAVADLSGLRSLLIDHYQDPAELAQLGGPSPVLSASSSTWTQLLVAD